MTHRTRLVVALALCCALGLALHPEAATAVPITAAPPQASAPLPRSTPEQQGIRSSAVLAFVEAAEKKVDALHSVMIVRHGQVVAEGWWSPYAQKDPHVLYSLSKSFTSTAVGLAIAEGRLTLDDSVLAAFPGEVPAASSDNLKAMRVRDLLTMSTGHHAEAIADFPYESEQGAARLFLALPVAHKPGTHFVYNSPASYMLSAMVQRATGSSVLDYLRPRLFDPLGIETPTWDADKHGVSLGGFGLRLKTEDIARFGQLYLQKGVWQGKRLLPAEWIEAATSRQVSNGSNPASDWEQGYGYQFWRCRHGVYRGDGAFGQFCVVMPQQDAVVAITSGTGDLQGVLNLVFEHLLPAMESSPLPPDTAAGPTLVRKLGSLTLPLQAGAASSPLASKAAGRRFVFPANDSGFESLALEMAGAEVTLVARRAGSESRVPVGHGRWGRSVTVTNLLGDVEPRFSAGRAERVAASGGWTADDTYTARLALCSTPFVLTVALRFQGEQLTFDREWDVAFGERKRPTLTGTAVAPAASARKVY